MNKAYEENECVLAQKLHIYELSLNVLEDSICAMNDEKELTFLTKYYPCKWLKTSDLSKYHPWYASPKKCYETNQATTFCLNLKLVSPTELM